MATLRNKLKLAALKKENCQEHSRSNLAEISNIPRSQEHCISQVSEEIEGRVTKKLSQEFSGTESRILGTLSQLHDFLRNPLIQGHSGTTPEMSRITLGANQGANEDDSQWDPEATISQSQNTRNTDPDDEFDAYWKISLNKLNWTCYWRFSRILMRYYHFSPF